MQRKAKGKVSTLLECRFNLITFGRIVYLGREVTSHTSRNARGKKFSGTFTQPLRNQAQVSIRANNHAAHIAVCLILPQQRTAFPLELEQKNIRDRARFQRAANPAAIATCAVIRLGRKEWMQPDCLRRHAFHLDYGLTRLSSAGFLCVMNAHLITICRYLLPGATCMAGAHDVAVNTFIHWLVNATAHDKIYRCFSRFAWPNTLRHRLV